MMKTILAIVMLIGAPQALAAQEVVVKNTHLLACDTPAELKLGWSMFKQKDRAALAELTQKQRVCEWLFKGDPVVIEEDRGELVRLRKPGGADLRWARRDSL